MDEPRSLQDIESIQSLDTARLALRWALEKIQSLEKDKAGLSEKAEAAERQREKTQENLISLQKTIGLKNAESTQRELYYAKLEEYLSLKLEGKLDVALLAKKELEVSQLQEMLSQKQAHLEKDFAARKEALERDFNLLRSELESETREKMRRSEATLEARRTALEEEFFSKNAQLSDRKAQIEAELKHLEERKAHFENYYKEERAHLQAALKGFRDEIKEEVALRVEMAERILEERRESLEKVYSEERALLIREIENWRSKVKELGPKNIDLEKLLALAEDKNFQVQASLDRIVLSREAERAAYQADKEGLLKDSEIWRKQALALLEESQNLKAKLSEAQTHSEISEKEAENLRGRIQILTEEFSSSRKRNEELWKKSVALQNSLTEALERSEALEERGKSNEARMKKELNDFIERHEALSAEFKEARAQSASQMDRLIQLEKELSQARQAAVNADLKLAGAQREIEILKNERQAAIEEVGKLRKEIESAMIQNLSLERNLSELEQKLRKEEKTREIESHQFNHEKEMWNKEREILEARLKSYHDKLETRVKAEVSKTLEPSSEPSGGLWPPVEWR
jgi:hypothetical protein